MGRVRVAITEGGLLATATAVAGNPMAPRELQELVQAAGVRHGIDGEAVAAFERSLLDPTFTGTVVVARGAAATPGVDGQVEGATTSTFAPGEKRADGSLDFRERHFLRPIAAAEVIARIVPPTAGTPGVDVRGAVIAARPGRPHGIRFGPGVRIVDDQVLARRSGVLALGDRKLDVVSVFTHKANVDYASGSLHTEGSLVVQGDLTPNFTVTAGGDVHVTGSVFDASVLAEGNIRIDQGAQGRAASLRAGGDVGCRHATSATLVAEGTIEIGDQATHCMLRATRLAARTGRGTVFGGEARMRSGIIVRTAGTAQGSPTTLAVGDVTDLAAMGIRERNLDHKVASRAQRCVAAGERGSTKALRQGLRSADVALANRLELARRQRELLTTATIEIIDTLHPGVDLVFGERRFAITTTRHRARFRWCEDTSTVQEERIP